MSQTAINRIAARYLKARTTVSTTKPGQPLWKWVKDPYNLNLMPRQNPRGMICKCRAPVEVRSTTGHSDSVTYDCVCLECGKAWPSWMEG